MKLTNLDMLETVAGALGNLCRDVVFVGGATVELYSTDHAAPRSRPTLDVDCVVKVETRVQFHAFEESLRRRGFTNDTSEGAPICRWLCHGVQVDVMSPRTESLGFTNEWYEEGIRHAVDLSLKSGQSIMILSAPYFIATKMTALRQRGITDLRVSGDFEDIVYVLRNRPAIFNEIIATSPEVRESLQRSFRELLSLEIINEAIDSVLDFGEVTGTMELVRAVMSHIASLPEL